MPQERKIRSVTELARYQVGDVAWWVILRPIETIEPIGPDEAWMTSHHPKALYERGPCRNIWGKALLPKLQHMDFHHLMILLTSKVLVEQFTVCDIIRSRDTGEFWYENDQNEWMPQSFLLDSKVAADRERLRILKLVTRWVEENK